MVPYKRLALSLSLLFCVLAAAKDKKKIVLPADVLQAQTVLVVIDPDAGSQWMRPWRTEPPGTPWRTRCRDWGRFRMALSASDADLVISVRKGSGKSGAAHDRRHSQR